MTATPADPDRQRLSELLWYADHNIALPDDELDEVEVLAARFGVRLVWRHFELGRVFEPGVTWQWKEGRGG